MRELITVQIGHCGNSIGTKFWELAAEDHGITNNGVYDGVHNLQQLYSDVLFVEKSDGYYCPRNIMVDSDPSTMQEIQGSTHGKMYNQDNYITSSWEHGQSSCNNWAVGMYGIGQEQNERYLDVMRKTMELCENCEGLKYIQSLAGGFGSGFGNKAIMRHREEYSHKLSVGCYILPNFMTSENTLEYYNTVLSMTGILNFQDAVFMMDNDALMRINQQKLHIPRPTYADINFSVAQALSSVSSGSRFPGQLNCGLRKIMTNQVPNPRHKIISVSQAPLLTRFQQTSQELSTTDILDELFSGDSQMVSTGNDFGTNSWTYRTASTILFRGQVNPVEIDDGIKTYTKDEIGPVHKTIYMTYIPDNIKYSICNAAPNGLKQNACMLSNGSEFQHSFEKIYNGFQKMFSRKAFLHNFTSEGMDEMEFYEAGSNLQEIIEYLKDLAFGSDEGFDDEEEGPELMCSANAHLA